jgi:hypothetical protein
LVCISQAGLELAFGSTGAFLFSQCNIAWRVLLISGFFFFFFCQVWLWFLRKIFDPHSSHCLLPPSSCHLGSLSGFFQERV